jgi:hypothetical protein
MVDWEGRDRHDYSYMVWRAYYERQVSDNSHLGSDSHGQCCWTTHISPRNNPELLRGDGGFRVSGFLRPQVRIGTLLPVSVCGPQGLLLAVLTSVQLKYYQLPGPNVPLGIRSSFGVR